MSGGASFPPTVMRPCVLRAYTLVEVMIVLVLLTTVILLISVSLDIHLRQMVVNRHEVEEAQLAQIILEKIARDIRSVVIPLREELLEIDTDLFAVVLGDEEYGEEYEDEETPILYGVVPGIYGAAEWLQIDVAKLPRGEMYGSRPIRRGSSSAADRLSASKTVLYYIGKDTDGFDPDDPRYRTEYLLGSLGRSLDPDAPQSGLFRRELDRQATQYILREGIEEDEEQHDELLAPEVAWIRFRYYDPTFEEQPGVFGAFLESWDMDDRQILPHAIEIAVAIRRPDLGRSFLSLGTAEVPAPVVYTLVVPIPVSIALPPLLEEELTDEDYLEEDFL